MKRTPRKKPGRSIPTGKRKNTNAAPVARKAKRGARKAPATTPSGLRAELEQQRDLLEIQNEELGKALTALEISHQRFSELHEQAPVGYLTFDAQGCVRATNIEAMRLLGAERPSVIGKPFVVYVEKEDRKKFLAHLWKIRTASSTVATDLRIATTEGRVLQVCMTTGRHHDAGGRSTLFLSAIEDVTELRTASANAAYFAAIVESSLDAIVSFSPEGIILSWNSGAERIMGYSAAEIIGRPRSILIPKDRIGETEQTMKVATGGSRVLVFGTVRKRKDGMLVDMEISLSPVVKDGRVVSVVSIGRDISERKRVDTALRESVQRERARREELETLMDAIPAAVFIAHNPTCTQMTGNRAGREMLRLSAGQNASKSAPNGEGPEFDIWTDGRLRAPAELPMHQAAATGEAVSHAELEMLFLDGAKMDLLGSALPLFDDSGAVRGCIGAFMDITAQKRAEEEVRASEQRMRLATEATGVGIWERNIVTHQIRWDAQMFRIYGIAPTRDGFLDYSTWSATVIPEDLAAQEAVLEDTVRRLGHSSRTFRIRRANDGECRYIQTVETVRTNAQGQAEWLVGTNLDVTERTRWEHAIQALNAELEERVATRTASLLTSTKSLMASVEALQKEREERRRLEREVIAISEAERRRTGQDLHDDLGQQLAGIRFFSSTLEKKLRDQSSPEADYAATIANMLSAALALTRSLARGLQPVMPEPGGLMAALRELTARSSDLFQLQCRFVSRRPVLVHDPAVATHLYRIAQEAVTNAAKHGHAKHISILLSSSPKGLLLSVNDDGTGMHESARGHDGMGIRMMSYRADVLGGSLNFRNRSGGGTSVVCGVPIPAKPSPKDH